MKIVLAKFIRRHLVRSWNIAGKSSELKLIVLTYLFADVVNHAESDILPVRLTRFELIEELV